MTPTVSALLHRTSGAFSSLRPVRVRCAHCGRRLDPGNSAGYRESHEEPWQRFHHDRDACQRAWNEAGGRGVDMTREPSTEASGAALIAAHYLTWPWWARLLPRSARAELGRRFARVMAPAVEGSVLRRAREAQDA